jgi:hypothetical protein
MKPVWFSSAHNKGRLFAMIWESFTIGVMLKRFVELIKLLSHFLKYACIQ